ncbi:MAG TPA: ABC transporter ATP-binding protein, partial [Opitutus sp.]|nr:ABC transporter ATP-binding protein [Opitutus sp.]
LRLFGALYRERASSAELLERFALADKANARFETLSGGQRQRLALALAFVNRPELVLLDEPTTGLDPQARRELHEEIRRMKSDGHTVLLTTHYLEEAEQLCDRIAIVANGRLIATGGPRELIARSSASQTIRVATAQPLDRGRFAALPGVDEVAEEGAVVTARTSDAVETLAGLARMLAEEKAELLELNVRKATLEDVFLGLTKNEGEA